MRSGELEPFLGKIGPGSIDKKASEVYLRPDKILISDCSTELQVQLQYRRIRLHPYLILFQARYISMTLSLNS